MNTEQTTGYVVLGADITKELASQRLTALANKIADPVLIDTVNNTELVTQEEAKLINPDIFTIEQYSDVEKALTLKSETHPLQITNPNQNNDVNDILQIPRNIRRKMLRGKSPKRVLKKLSTVNYMS